MTGFFFLIQYKSNGILKLILDIETGNVRRFNTRRDARKYAIQNMLGIYAIYQFKI